MTSTGTTTASSSSTSVKFDSKIFYKHLNRLYDYWSKTKTEVFNGAELLVFCAGSAEEQENNTPLSKTSVLQLWLLGYELSDTLIVCTPAQCLFLSSSKKTKLLQAMQSSHPQHEQERIKLTLLTRTSNLEDDLSRVVSHMRSEIERQQHGAATIAVGVIQGEEARGEFAQTWQRTLLAERSWHCVDVTRGLATLFACKDDTEQKWLRTAAAISSTVMKNFLIPKIEQVIDEDKRVTHAQIASEIEATFLNPEIISKSLTSDVVDTCFTPVIQSGGVYHLLIPDNVMSSAVLEGAEKTLHASCIVLCLGAKFKQYCATIGRTLFVNPTPQIRADYELLCAVQTRIIETLRPGVTLAQVYRQAQDMLQTTHPRLWEHFLKNCGCGTGLQCQEREYVIDATNTAATVEEGMVFTVRVGFENLTQEDANDTKARVYSLFLADTVLVKRDGCEELTKCKKKFNEVSYFLEAEAPTKPESKGTTSTNNIGVETKGIPPNQEAKVKSEKAEKSEEGEGEEESESSSSEREEPSRDSIARATRLREKEREQQKDKASLLQEEKRKANQARLAKLQAEIARERYLKLKRGIVDSATPKLDEHNAVTHKDYTAYHSPSEFPKEAEKDKIFVDVERDAILLPIYGLLVPFHITTVKSVSKSEDYIRIIFKSPGNVGPSEQNPFPDPTATFLKEVTFRVPNPRALNTSYRMVNELRKRVTQRETERATLAGLKEQEVLQLMVHGKPPRLQNLSIRPNLGGRKTTGTLEAHTNGFRFITSKKGKVDIIYSNIKHAFFQPAERELIVLVHFHLHNAIMIGKKKTVDVQFYTEVMEVSQALGPQRHRFGDAEELEDEQRERELRNRLNQEFQNFVKKVEELGVGIEFDIPYRELGFYGVPFRNNVLLQPTVHCLVNLVEAPFFVLTLSEVEIAYFERVQFSLRYFDLVFVLKDWNKPVVHINGIPVESLDTIKEWLDSCDIKYYEGTKNLVWPRVMQQIRENPKKFWKAGGWNFLESESSDEENNEEADEDDYQPSGSDSDDYTHSDSSESGSSSELTAESDSDEPESVDEEEGEDWDTLEAKAAQEDQKRAQKRKERGEDIDSDDERPSSKRSKKGK